MNWFKKLSSQIQNEKRLEQLYNEAVQMGKSPEEASWIISILKEVGYDNYFKWLVTIVNTNNADIDNVGDKLNLIEALKEYHKLKLKKKLPQNQTNLMRFKNVSDLYTIVNQRDEIVEQELENRLKGINPNNYKIVYNKDGTSIIYVDNWEAASQLFKDSSWCVRHKNTFHDFKKYPPNYYLFLVDGNNFALLNPEIQEFLDRNDDPLSIDQLFKIKYGIQYLLENSIISENQIPDDVLKGVEFFNKLEENYKSGNYEALKAYFIEKINNGRYNILESEIYKKYPVLSEEEIGEALKPYFIENLNYGGFDILESEIYKKYPVLSEEEIKEGLKPFFIRQLRSGRIEVLESEIYIQYPALSEREIKEGLKPYFIKYLGKGKFNFNLFHSDFFKKYSILSNEEIGMGFRPYFIKKFQSGDFHLLNARELEEYPILSDEEIKTIIFPIIKNNPSSVDKYEYLELIKKFPEVKQILDNQLITASNWIQKIHISDK